MPIKVGDFFHHRQVPYLLAQVGARQVCLVSLDDGQRFREAVVVRDPLALTQKEFSAVRGLLPMTTVSLTCHYEDK